MGLPQGSVLSPILFNIYTMDFHRFFDVKTKTLQYADDFCLYSQQDTYDKCVEQLNSIMCRLKEYLFRNNFSLSQEKSTVVFFTRRRIQQNNSIVLNNSNIPCSKSFKYLGIVLDQKLNWREHIDLVTNKAEKSLNILKLTCRKTFGSNPRVATTFYRAYTRSIMDYGSILYGSASNSHLEKVDKVQYKALRLVHGAIKSTPIESLLAISHEPPLYLRRLFLAKKFLVKQKDINAELCLNVHALSIHNLTNSYWKHKNSPPLAEVYPDVHKLNLEYKLQREIVFKSPYEAIIIRPSIIIPSQIPDNVDIIPYYNNILEKHPEASLIFTDGSKIGNKTGCAVYCKFNGNKCCFRLNERASIFTAETISVIKALNIAIQEQQHEFLIFTDSLSLLLSLNNLTGVYNNPFICYIKTQMLELNQLGKNVPLPGLEDTAV